ncbi:MAG: tyrosine-type recombinase/integrase [Terriglobales bacterium]
MSVYKRGTTYWYRFMWNGKRISISTKLRSRREAETVEAKHVARLAGERDAHDAAAENLNCESVLLCSECKQWFDATIAVRDNGRTFCGRTCRLSWAKRYRAVPTLIEFCEQRFAPWAESTSSLKTWRDFYRVGLMAIKAYSPLASLPLDALTTETIAGFAAHRRAQGKKVATVNASLRILRRILHIAIEWGEIERMPKIKLLAGEAHRDRVITPDEEARYLAAATPLLADVAGVLCDTGLRPEECHRLVWGSFTWTNGRNGSLLVTHGKTAAAHREIPLTPRCRYIFETRWRAAGMPTDGWCWPGPTRSGHIEPCTLKKQHRRALKISKVTPFVLYSLRHTFLTRLGQSGCDVWTLARVAGHSSIAISARYVHPSEDAVLGAMARLETGTKLVQKKNRISRRSPRLLLTDSSRSS